MKKIVIAAAAIALTAGAAFAENRKYDYTGYENQRQQPAAESTVLDRTSTGSIRRQDADRTVSGVNRSIRPNANPYGEGHPR